MKVFGITGWKNSGKTTLVVDLVSLLTQRGLRVSTIKHAHHNFDIDKPGTDSHSHRQAGAQEVVISSVNRWALMHELKDEAEPELAQLLQQLSEVDLVLVEGFKNSQHPKLHIIRADSDTTPLPASARPIVAIASDGDVDLEKHLCEGPVLPLNDREAIADFIMTFCGFKK